MSSSIEDDDFSTLSAASSIAPAPSSTISLSDPTSAPTTLMLAPSPTDDDLDEDQTFPPMTTPWTGPASCTWTYDADKVPKSGSMGLAAYLDLEPIPGAKSLSCYPDAMFAEGITGVYSPGTCPHGWFTASIDVGPAENRDDEITTAFCCSSKYLLEGSLCTRTTSSVIAVPYTYNHTARSYDALSDSTTTLYSATVAVYAIRALFKDSDKDALGLKDEDDIGLEHDTQSLSLGARIGIGVGVAVFVLLAIGAVAFWLMRRERARTEKRRAHELNAVGSMRHNSEGPGDNFYAAGEARHRRDRSRQLADPPPPAYEAATDSNSMTENDSRLSEDTATRDETIRALQVQKEAIQRRIEELERSETQSQEDTREDNRQN
ncbi:hypothetical protein NW762_000460 [Fusarium torreyae]|uniref:Uncharacterized protein n=1 Tax=Fusarium torreyae TaxID=1237075 RepID=A0A9W8SGE1_9HYPO|nr:hypothetical protein NW762_000460 [Fusarium torreyae]